MVFVDNCNGSSVKLIPGQQNREGVHGSSHYSESKKSKSERRKKRLEICYKILLKCVYGLIMVIIVTGAWLGSTHLLKSTYSDLLESFIWPQHFNFTASTRDRNMTGRELKFNAPFFTTWICSLSTLLFLPLFLVAQTISKTGKRPQLVATLQESVQSFRNKGFGLGKFIGRCCLFSILWMLTNYLYIYALKILGCTEVMALFATNISFIYLLSWVVLHQQFVGIRIVAVILSNMGIALLAYMDGINETPTLGGVVLASAAAAGSAVFKVLFKRVLGEVSFCQVSMFFSTVGLCCLLLYWPIVLTLAFTGLEIIHLDFIPWPSIGGSMLFSLVANLLANFGVVVTYENFITLGLILAVPACAALDHEFYAATFTGMKLTGIILISSGFLVVLLPSNWSELIKMAIRWGRRSHREDEIARRQPPDLRTGHIGSRLRSPSGRVR